MNKKIAIKLLLIALISLLLSTLSNNETYAGWEWQNPLPQGNILTSVWMASPNHIYAVGYGSTIIQSGDGGESWEVVDRVTPYNLSGIWGTGNNNIYAVGEKGTILHYDGMSWKEVQPIAQNNLNAVWGTGKNNIFIVGDGGTILHYNGFSFMEHQPPVTEHLCAIWGRGENDIYAVGGDRKVSGEDMVGTGGVVIHFDGNGWSFVEHGIPDLPNLNGIWGEDDGHLYITGGDRRNNAYTGSWHGTGGIILHYDGSNWNLWSGNADWNLHSIWGNENNIYTVGAYYNAIMGDAPINYGKLFSLNGEVWQEVTVEGGDINGLLSIGGSGDTIFAVGLYGTILRYNASGWQEVSYGTKWPRLFMLGGIYPDHLYAVGGTWDYRPGMVLHYNTTMERWEEVYSGDSSYFLGVLGAGPNDIYVVGDYNLHYNGSSWEEFTTCTTGDHFWIWGLGPDNIYTWKPCHFDGTEWKTLCWDIASSQWHGEIWGTSTTDIYGAGDSGLILHYDGAICQEMDSGTDEILRGIWGSSAQDIYAVGGDGLTGFSGILHFDGQNWEELTIPNVVQQFSELVIYFGVWGTGPDNVFVAGFNGIDFDKGARPSKYRGVTLHYNGLRWEDMSSGMGVFNNFVWGVEDGSRVYTGGMAATILRYIPSIRGSIEGCVEDTSGSPVPDATISLYAMGNADWYILDSQSTGEDGCFKINYLEPGRYFIVAENDGFLPTWYPSYSSFKLLEGENINIGTIYLIEGVISTTTTTIVSTTTTTIICSAEELYGEHSDKIELLRYLRDNVLSKTPEGQEIIRLYYEWSPMIVKAMEEDEGFKEQVKEMIDGILRLIDSQLE